MIRIWRHRSLENINDPCIMKESRFPGLTLSSNTSEKHRNWATTGSTSHFFLQKTNHYFGTSSWSWNESSRIGVPPRRKEKSSNWEFKTEMHVVSSLGPPGHVPHSKMIVFSVSGPLEIPNDWCIMNERRLVVEMVTEKLHFREISKLSLFSLLKWCFSFFLCYAGPIGLFEDEETRNNLVYGPGKRSF